MNRDPRNAGRNYEPSSDRSKEHSCVSSNNFTAVNDCEESSVCIKIYSILPVDQFILRNSGFELSYRNKIGEVTRWCLQSSNKVRERFQEIIGIRLPWKFRCSLRRGLILVTNQRQYRLWRLQNLIKGRRDIVCGGRGQSFIISTLDSLGKLSSVVFVTNELNAWL